jgi:hypothetical protein
VVLRYGERPEDLNVPDNAGNTPLQVASLNGEEQIVKFLLDAGCEINTKNIDKDTPLIDAVENGNVEVVKLLLEAGANPRTVNASGDEPYELVPTDLKDDEYDEIRKLLADAKANSRPGRRSEEQQAGPDKPPRSRRASVASPSRSPPPMSSTTGRRKTGRSEATRNDLLWTQPTSENLREFAAKGDEQGVVSILNILQKADNASLIAAAKGGHFDVLSLMYAIGDADADPNPLRGSGHKPGYNTPMLAAIGRGNMDNIQLILGQPGFDPTRRLFEDKTYYELSRSRQGENWEEEYDILKKAYENYAGSGKGRKDLSSPRRPRGKDKEEKRSARRESSSPVARTKKLNDSSPNANRQRFPKDYDALKEKRREEKKAAAAAAGGRSKTTSRETRDTRDAHDNALASSDHDSARPEPKKPKAAPSARRGSESSGVARADEVRKRRLIAGRRPLDGDRRPSLMSSDSLSGREEAPRSRDTAPDSTSSLKRIRNDTSPERSRSRDGGSDRLSPEARKKKRRVLAEEKASNLPNGPSRKAEDTNGDKLQQRRPKEEALQGTDPASRKSTETSKKPDPSSHKPDSSSQSTSSQKSTESDPPKKNGDVKTEPPEPTPNSIPEVSSDDKRAEIEAEKRRQAEVKKAEEERVAEEKRREEEAERARLAKEEAERARLAKEEAERARLAKEEAERARLAKEEAERAAREKAEEDERKRKEMEQRRAKQAEDERQKRLEQERARVIKMRREQEAQEQRRRDALPGRLRASANFVGSNDPRARSHSWLKNFMPLVTVLTRQLDAVCASDVADEKWIPNYLVAPLLATNDLQLSQCKFLSGLCRDLSIFCSGG